MKDIQVKEVMIPISNYVTVKKETSLVEVMQALETERSGANHAHRDAIVVDDDGKLIGKVTMIDIFRSLEPNYKRVDLESGGGVLTADFVKKAIENYNLWIEPMQDICERGGTLKVETIMHTPEKVEYIEESDTLEKALHLYVMGVHQPIIVTDGGKVTGVLRFGDLFEVVRERLLKCKIG